MRRKRMSGHGFHPRACTGKRTPRGYTMNGNSENVVVINVDDDDDDVIIIDYPDSRGEKEAPHPTVISIDDEDSDVDHPGIGVPGVSELDSDATSNKRFFPSPDTAGNPLDFDANQNHTVQKEKSPSRLSKCRKSYIEKTPCRNRYGFNPESEDGPSESDYSDCEVLEGSFEELREQWERTYSKQKSKSFNCRYGAEDQASTSTFHAGAHMNAGQYRNDFFRDQVFSFSNNDKGEEDLSRGNDAYLNTWHKEDLRKRGSSQPDEKTAWLRSQKKAQAQFVTVNGNVQVGEETCTDKGPADAQQENSSGSSMNTLNEDQGRKDTYWWFNIVGGAKQNDCAEEHHEEKDERNDEASCHSSSQSVNCDDEESDSYRSQVFGEANMPKRSFPMDCNNVIFQKESCGNSCSLNEMHKVNVAGYTEELLWDHLVQKSKPFDEINTGKDGNDKGDHVGKSSINCTPIVSHEEPQEKPELLEKRSCSMKDQEPFVKSASTTQSSEERNVDCSPIMQDSIINGREKLKETDEYRRAQEEEWASRQRQLQLQAEEAQRLRKRKKAEALRILDMERRQKQRVEEIRKTQQKDEENMNLKEKLRAEMRRELTKLEMSCIDMPSLLRGLGIHVGSSPSPVSQEVRSAYKRALLRFHPDRASRNDIRQQVEAEEKFKLISRMKEKFLLTSCH